MSAPFIVDLDPDQMQPMRCDCGWRGLRRDQTLHPRQGFRVCPRCWRNGYERMTSPDVAVTEQGER
jgi:hypothetical protein